MVGFHTGEWAKGRISRSASLSVVESTVSAATQASRDAAAKAIVVLAASGATTQLFAKYKCGIPLIVVTAHDSVARYAQALIPGASRRWSPRARSSPARSAS